MRRSDSDHTNRVEPYADIAAGRYREFGFVVIQIAGGVNQLVPYIIISPAKSIPQVRVIIHQSAAGQGRYEILKPSLRAPDPARPLLDVRGLHDLAHEGTA